MSSLSSHKKAIAVSILLRQLCFDNLNESLCQLPLRIVSSEKEALFQEALVFGSLKRLVFLHYLGLCAKVVEALPAGTLSRLRSYWQSKEQVMRARNRGRGGLFRPYFQN